MRRYSQLDLDDAIAVAIERQRLALWKEHKKTKADAGLWQARAEAAEARLAAVFENFETYWGPRCSDYEPDCACCRAWAARAAAIGNP